MFKTSGIFFLFVFPWIHCASAGDSNSLAFRNRDYDYIEDQVSKIANYYNNLSKSKTKVEVLDVDYNYSVPQTIVLSRRYLKKIYDKHGDEFVSCLSFLLGHEFSHQWQFAELDPKLLSTNSCEVRTLIEAQADVLGGYLFSIFWNLNDSIAINGSKNFDKMKAVSEFVYDLGTYEYGLGSHPGYQQRRNAFRHGWSFSFLEGNLPEIKKEIVRKTLKYNGSDGIFNWSLEISKKVIHYPRRALTDIAIVSDSVYFYKDSKNPKVFYHTKFKNIGKKEINLELQYKVVGIDTNFRKDPRQLVLQGVEETRTTKISPGEVVTQEGLLDWSKVSFGKYRPALLAPPNLEVVYQATYVDNKVEIDNFCPSQTEFQSNTILKAIEAHALSSIIMQLGQEASTDFIKLATGFASQITPDLIDYNCMVEVPGAEEVLISRYTEDNSVTLDILFYYGDDDTLSENIFRYLIGRLEEMERQKFLTIRRDYESLFERVYEEEDSVYLGYKYEMINSIVLQKRNNKKNYISVEGKFANNLVTQPVSFTLTRSNNSVELSIERERP